MNRKQRRRASKLGQVPSRPAVKTGTVVVPPGDADLVGLGLKHHQAGRFAEAEACYRRVLAAQPDHADALHLLGIIAQQTGRHELAVELISRAIKQNGRSAAYFCSLGIALKNQGKIDEAVKAYRQAIRIKPDLPEAHCNLGNALRGQGKLDEAVAACSQAIRIKPDLAEAHFNLGNALHGQGRLDEALASYDRALSLRRDYAEALNNRGNVLQELKRLGEALASYDQAISLRPDYAGALSNRGNVLRELKRLDEALASHDRALMLRPDYADALYNRGNVLQELRRLDEALVSYDRALTLRPDYAEALYNRANALRELNRLDEALASYDRALTLRPNYADALCNRGNALRELNRLDEALASYDKAIALKPDYAEAYSNRGIALTYLKRPADALASYDKAFALKHDLAEVEGLRLHTKMHLCDWSNFDNECTHLISSVRSGKGSTPPFQFLSIASTSADQLRCAKLYIANKYLPSEKPIWQGERYNHDRIRVAYLSADFRKHPGAYRMAGLFEQHDRSRFEVIGISFGVDDRSEIRKRVAAAFDEFYDVRGKSDQQVAKLLHDLQVDIAIDRNGYTTDSRPGIIAHRPAPIQISYLGYPATMGTPFIDYIIADKVVAPLEDQRFYTEKIVHLPNSYQVNDRKYKIAESAPSRQENGLPQGFVFCCFNNNYKITPRVFECWTRILKQVEDSVLWLLEGNATAASNLRKEAVARGINSDRLIFAKRMPSPEHLARHRLADLFLDTLPYNAHATATDALWAGLPVLTCLGETFAGRVAASLLTAIRLPELITTTLEDYEHLAIELATHPEKMAIIKSKLAENRFTTPLFDTKLFTNHIEAAYTAMYERHKAGLAPDHIIIPNS
jgi:protein O-GlcNAc transferase